MPIDDSSREESQLTVKVVETKDTDVVLANFRGDDDRSYETLWHVTGNVKAVFQDYTMENVKAYVPRHCPPPAARRPPPAARRQPPAANRPRLTDTETTNQRHPTPTPTLPPTLLQVHAYYGHGWVDR